MATQNEMLLKDLIEYLLLLNSSLNDERLSKDISWLKKVDPKDFGAMQASQTLFGLFCRHEKLRSDEELKKLCLSIPEARELKLKG